MSSVFLQYGKKERWEVYLNFDIVVSSFLFSQLLFILST